VYDYPRVKWRWKVNNLYAKGNARTKAGDDYPCAYSSCSNATGHGRTVREVEVWSGEKMYGEYPPHSDLSYVWSSREEPASIIVSPYTDRAMMVLLQSGAKKVGTWQEQEINIVEIIKGLWRETAASGADRDHE